MSNSIMKPSLHTPFANALVAKHDGLLCDDGPEEQAARVVAALERVSAVTPFAPMAEHLAVDLAGFGEVPIVYVTEDEDYLLLSDAADALGWPLHKAHAWARHMHDYAIRDQREADEARGDGRIGWDRLLDYVDLGLNLIEDDPGAKPDAGGRRWAHAGDWLISKDRVPHLLVNSPWGKEFVDNSLPAFGHAMRKVWGDKLRSVPTLGEDGTPTGGNAYDDLFSTDGLTEEEALRRARRGPALGDDEPPG
ncbi:hypothetical protein [Nocardiopsis trehalosi]|uniref:hypothetical protein n=1 Tax=Nocardiopsis trehalosi TaxID=109329 RepID=UPI000831B838|nr:hypothetical protein [Nocardiopsis trehalosi]